MAIFAFRHQPLKSIYFLYSAVTIPFIRLPFWTITSLLPSWRPRRSWGFSRAVRAQAVRAFVSLLFTTGYQFMFKTVEKMSKLPGFVWVEPISQDLIQGDTADMAKINNVVPVRTCGFWFEKDATEDFERKAIPEEKVIYVLHGK